MLTIKIIPNEKNNPPGKLADAEIHFTGPWDERVGEHHAVRDATGATPSSALDGLKLIGFGVWERRTGGGRNVTFPARQYVVNGERRSFALLRPTGDVTAQDRIREAILEAYAEYEEKEATRA